MNASLSATILASATVPSAFLDECTAVAGNPLVRDYNDSGVAHLRGIVRSYAIAALREPSLRELVAHCSYSHPLGFEKIVLWDGERGERIRVHIRRKTSPTSSIKVADVHDHYWDFRSVVLQGQLTVAEYASEEKAEATVFSAYSMEPIGNGAHILRYQGKRTLSRQRTYTLSTGHQHVLSAGKLHATTARGGCISLVAQGPRRQSSNIVYKRNGPERDVRNDHLPYLSQASVILALEELATLDAP